MPRPKTTDEMVVKRYLATCDERTLHGLKDLLDVLIMAKGGEPPLVKRVTHRKPKIEAQIPLVVKEGM